MKRALQGRYLTISTTGEDVRAFVPAPLPPRPAIDWNPALRARFDQALLALGQLDAVTLLLPDTSLLLYSFVRKEAVLSSMIEGTRSSMADLMLFELDQQPGAPVEDAREVSLCIAALDHGLKRLREGFPRPCDFCARYTASCSTTSAAGTRIRANSVAARTGSAARGRVTPCTSHRPPRKYRSA